MIKVIKILLLFLPHGLSKYLESYSSNGLIRYFKYKKILARNITFKSAAVGSDRCFILCNGPSVKKQDLSRLKNEVVISVSSGYLHNQFSEISPQFHCVPQITYGLLTETDVVTWFREMDAYLGNAILFLSDSEYDLVQKYGLFKNRQVHYLNLGRRFITNENQLFDLSKMLPAPASAPIMCLMVAMYMGYKKIYLLGTEHDSFKTNEYLYAFPPKAMQGKDLSVKENGQLRGYIYDVLKPSTILWEQYRAIKTLAAQWQVEIYNATLGGALDEFERVDIDTLFDDQ